MPFDFSRMFATNPFVNPSTGQNIWTNPGGGGLLGGVNPYQELANIGTGLLAGSGPSLEPQSPGSRLGKAFAYASERRDAGLLNDARRMQIAASAQETAAKANLMEALKTGKIALPGVTPETASALIASGNDALLGHLIPQSLTPEAQAQLAAGYPAIQKAQQDVKKEEDLQGIERVTSNTTVRNALEAEKIITRMESGPVPPGSTAATLAKKLSDPDGYITVSPAIIAQASATVLGGKPLTEAQAAQWQTDWNRLNKLSAKFITDQRALSAQQQATGGAGRQTDFGLSFIQDQNISPTVTGNANRAILTDLIQRQRDIAKVRGWTLDNSDTIDETLKKWEQQLTPVADYSTAPPAPQGATVAGVPGVTTEPSFMEKLFTGLQPGTPQAAAPTAPTARAGAAPATAPPVTVSPPANLPPAAQSLPRNAAGVPTFARKIDLERAERAGKLKGVTAIELMGKTYDWQPE